MNDLLYLVYGQNKIYYQQGYFSILTALKFLGESKSTRVCVFTENPDYFSDLPIVAEKLTDDQIKLWQGKAQYNHRLKNVAMKFWMDKYKNKTILVDTDTWYKKNPELLFQRVSPGFSLMFQFEKYIQQALPTLCERIVENNIVSQNGNILDIAKDGQLWNSGVVGLSYDDRHLLDEALYVLDQVYDITKEYVTEQLAIGEVLSRNTKLSGCDDILAHYYGAEINFINDKVGIYLNLVEKLSISQKINALVDFHFVRYRKKVIKLFLIKIHSKRQGFSKDVMRALQGIELYLLDESNLYDISDQKNWLLNAYTNLASVSSGEISRFGLNGKKCLVKAIKKLVSSNKLSQADKTRWLELCQRFY
ncbi:hypothetical protein [Spartinivicinus poritis]|uniref:Uncharacterized protein n=1 Tax=Spartinivicinus poritis TaxID=2994640 RepID=A0ABT5U6I9_9GAMM|nr:hypothetical protein [Spartinivicinus sp. A2-2]MDE1461927.1 hypothetical protein [Spartinivicinus sp. A2-2]